jgi:hypothetical protein
MKIKGAMVFGGVPSNQEEDQKEALEPSPMVTRVAALKRSLSVASLGVSDPTHGFSGAFHSSHNHRSLSARENFSRSRTLRPPRSLGLPVDLAFPPADDFLAGPKHTATDLGEGL